MARVVTAFITICMVVIAASVGAVAYMQFGAGLGEAAVLCVMALLVALMVQSEAARRRERRQIAVRFDEVLEHFEATADEIGNVERRLAALEAKAQPDRAKEIAPVIAEVEVLGTIVTQLAEQMTDTETRIAGLEEAIRQVPVMQADRHAPKPVRSEPPPPVVEEIDEDEEERRREAERAEAERRRLLAAVTAALDAGRIELHMQPIVTFPQRHVRFYEVLTRLLTEDGIHIYPEEFLDVAEKAGLMPQIDRFVLQHASRIARRLSQRNRNIGLFCNLSGTSLIDESFFAELTRFLEINRDLVDLMIFELSQGTIRAMGPLELECLTELRNMGCRFSLERIRDLHIDFADLSSRGFRFAKVAAERLLDEESPPRGDIHVVDLAALAARFGIEIIADHIEREAQVIGLLDYDVKFGQGALFAPPKPVRSDVLAALPGSDGASKQPQRRVG